MIAASIFAPVLAPLLYISAWVVGWNPASISTFEKQASKLSEIMPERYEVSAAGTIALKSSWKDADWKRVQAAARKHQVKVLGMVHNFVLPDGFDAKRMSLLLNDPKKVKAAISDLLAFVKKDSLDGIDLDLESMAVTDRNAFSSFVSALAKALHGQKKILSVTVHPKESEPGNWDGPKAHDWKAIGAVADRVKIMCYDVHWSTSDAGSIAPTEWVTRVAKFAMTQMPASKVDIAVAWYGYDWRQKPALSLTYSDLSRLPSRMDASSGELVQMDKVYFSGRAAFEQKVAALKALGLNKVSAWYVGSEDPDVWRVIPAK
jgi:spore germination protein YaaH